MQLVIFLPTFNTPCMRLKIRYDGCKRKYFGFAWQLNRAIDANAAGAWRGDVGVQGGRGACGERRGDPKMDINAVLCCGVQYWTALLGCVCNQQPVMQQDLPCSGH
jgi:hypothetical protein